MKKNKSALNIKGKTNISKPKMTNKLKKEFLDIFKHHRSDLETKTFSRIELFFSKNDPSAIQKQTGMTYYHLCLESKNQAEQDLVDYTIEYLIKNAKSIINHMNSSGDTPLNYAIYNRHPNNQMLNKRINLIELLLINGADPKIGNTIEYAINHGIYHEQLYNLLVKYGALTESNILQCFFTIIWKFVRTNDTKLLKTLENIIKFFIDYLKNNSPNLSSQQQAIGDASNLLNKLKEFLNIYGEIDFSNCIIFKTIFNILSNNISVFNILLKTSSQSHLRCECPNLLFILLKNNLLEEGHIISACLNGIDIMQTNYNKDNILHYLLKVGFYLDQPSRVAYVIRYFKTIVNLFQEDIQSTLLNQQNYKGQTPLSLGLCSSQLNNQEMLDLITFSIENGYEIQKYPLDKDFPNFLFILIRKGIYHSEIYQEKSLITNFSIRDSNNDNIQDVALKKLFYFRKMEMEMDDNLVQFCKKILKKRYPKNEKLDTHELIDANKGAEPVKKQQNLYARYELLKDSKNNLFNALYAGIIDLQLIKSLYNEGFNLNEQDEYGNTLLHLLFNNYKSESTSHQYEEEIDMDDYPLTIMPNLQINKTELLINEHSEIIKVALYLLENIDPKCINQANLKGQTPIMVLMKTLYFNSSIDISESVYLIGLLLERDINLYLLFLHDCFSCGIFMKKAVKNFIKQNFSLEVKDISNNSLIHLLAKNIFKLKNINEEFFMIAEHVIKCLKHKIDDKNEEGQTTMNIINSCMANNHYRANHDEVFAILRFKKILMDMPISDYPNIPKHDNSTSVLIQNKPIQMNYNDLKADDNYFTMIDIGIYQTRRLLEVFLDTVLMKKHGLDPKMLNYDIIFTNDIIIINLVSIIGEDSELAKKISTYIQNTLNDLSSYSMKHLSVLQKFYYEILISDNIYKPQLYEFLTLLSKLDPTILGLLMNIEPKVKHENLFTTFFNFNPSILKNPEAIQAYLKAFKITSVHYDKYIPDETPNYFKNFVDIIRKYSYDYHKNLKIYDTIKTIMIKLQDKVFNYMINQVGLFSLLSYNHINLIIQYIGKPSFPTYSEYISKKNKEDINKIAFFASSDYADIEDCPLQIRMISYLNGDMFYDDDDDLYDIFETESNRDYHSHYRHITDRL